MQFSNPPASPANGRSRSARRVSAYKRGNVAFAVSATYATIVIVVSIAEALWLYLPAQMTGIVGAPIPLGVFLVTMPISIPVLFLGPQVEPVWLGTVLYHSMTVGGLFQAWLLWRVLRGPKNTPNPADAG